MAETRETFPVIIKPDEDSDEHKHESSGASADHYDYQQQQDDGTHVLANQDTTTEAQQLVTTSYGCLAADCTTSKPTTSPTPQCTVKTEPDTEDVNVGYNDCMDRDIKPLGTVTCIPQAKDEPGTPVRRETESTSDMGCDDSNTDIDSDQLQPLVQIDTYSVNTIEEQASSIGNINSCNKQISEEHTGDTEQFMEPNTSQEHSEGAKSSSQSRDNTTQHMRQQECLNTTTAHKCSVCDKCFQCPSHLKRHMIKHTGLKPYQCPVCDKYFSQKGHLATHTRIHSGERPYVCTVCGKSFAENGSLTKHTRLHTSEKPYQCTVCGKSFVESGSLTKHTRRHTGQKPFECSVCGKSFTNTSDLKVHKRRHTGEKPYACQVCGKRFVQSGNLTRHMNRHKE